jgi:CheY-like chemotaxis protein
MARIAVVDDSKLVRVFVAATLGKAGHEVVLIEPESLQAAMDDLLETKPDLMVLDHSMPAFEGPSLVRACFERPELSGIKVIILTAFHDEDIAERMQKLGVACVLHKPILHGDLTLAVEQALAAPPRSE